MRFLITVPDELHKKLCQAADTRGQTLSALVREFLWSLAEQHESQIQHLQHSIDGKDEQHGK